LESDRESPADWGVTIVDEAEAEFEPVCYLNLVSMMRCSGVEYLV
jgi:hypothetical protein